MILQGQTHFFPFKLQLFCQAKEAKRENGYNETEKGGL